MKDKEKVKRYRFHIIMSVLIIIFCIGIAPKGLQNDTFYTIKIGEYITENGIGNLREDPFSWQELPYTFPHWLYDLCMFLIYSLGGMFGIYMSTIVLTSILGLSIYFTANKLSKNAPISAMVTFIAMYLMRPYLAARAQLVTFSFMVLTIYLIEKFLEQGKKRYAIGLVIFSLLIVNMHMAVWPFFFVLFIPYLFEYVISLDIFNFDLIIKFKIFILKLSKGNEEKLAKLYENLEENKKNREKVKTNPYKIRVIRNDNIKKLFLVMIICAFMGLLTPTGITTPYTYLYKTMTGNTMEVINEHKPLDLAKNKEFVVYFLIFVAVLTFVDVKIDLKHLCYYLRNFIFSFKFKKTSIYVFSNLHTNTC